MYTREMNETNFDAVRNNSSQHDSQMGNRGGLIQLGIVRKSGKSRLVESWGIIARCSSRNPIETSHQQRQEEFTEEYLMRSQPEKRRREGFGGRSRCASEVSVNLACKEEGVLRAKRE
jgi:hypothetical protein